ncbi:aspartate--tRNA ligase [Spirochaeta lutea]|uniref:aspartate--tRNA ligase n=1 Tax=Spirochaeta lutea TaxID=1480694 RepID=UPI0006897229|nr:aspartate--tRNA ligase [Spirochaeta lutea]
MEAHKRTVTCGQLRTEDAGKQVVLNGWVHRHRDHGGVIFINLRDRYGITQVVVDEHAAPQLRETAEELKFEYCIAVTGTVQARPDSMVNSEMNTGGIEVIAEHITILSRCATLPFMIDEKAQTNEDLRLKYRYLDLRTGSMQKKISLRSQVMFRTREYLTNQGFLEIETPTMIRSTPEGARDFLVPSRISKGRFYALPQSPQLFKQILMVSGFDKYFQLAHCFRDEDPRGDRQPEHTQIDMEMSFVDQEDVFALVEGLMAHIFKNTMGLDLPLPFQRLPYEEAMDRFGSDKPDLRFDLEMKDAAFMGQDTDFKVFSGVLERGGAIRALVVPGKAEYSRKQISDLEDVAKTYHAKGLAWLKVTDDGLDGGIAKFFTSKASEIRSKLGAQSGDLVLFVADKKTVANTALGAVRTRLGKDLGLAEQGSFRFAWIVDFPLFEWNEDEEKWDAAHHMFTMPQAQYLETMESDPGSVKGNLYDLVCNGYELASGSIRIHDPQLQQRIFNIVGFPEEEAKQRFGFLLDAFQYGAPPHGGIAPGLDRLLMIMTGESTIREVMAFPKNSAGLSPMDESPSPVEPGQLQELGLQFLPGVLRAQGNTDPDNTGAAD